MSPRAGQVVTFTAGPLGLVETLGDTRFRAASVVAGDTGVYVALHPTLADHGWHLVRVRELLCPCHASQFSTGGGS